MHGHVHWVWRRGAAAQQSVSAVRAPLRHQGGAPACRGAPAHIWPRTTAHLLLTLSCSSQMAEEYIAFLEKQSTSQLAQIKELHEEIQELHEEIQRLNRQLIGRPTTSADCESRLHGPDGVPGLLPHVPTLAVWPAACLLQIQGMRYHY